MYGASVLRSFQFPLRPTKEEEKLLLRSKDLCRQLYNGALEERKSAYKLLGKSLSFFDQTKSLTEIRRDDPESFGSISALIARSALSRVQKGFDAFFRRVKAGEKPGHPKFKGRDQYRSFSTGPGITVRHWVKGVSQASVNIPKIGRVKFHEHRLLEGKILDAVVKYETTNKWTITFQCEVGSAPERAQLSELVPEKCVGLDVGLKEFVTLSTGEAVHNPRHFREGQEKLASLQRKWDSKKHHKRSKRKERARVQVAKAHKHVSNQRKDFQRKLAKKLVTRFDLIAYEDLTITSMVHGSLAKSINDAAWGQFFRFVDEAAETLGKWTVAVDPRGTTIECSGCGKPVPKDLSTRTHECTHCGLVLDRDHNAALNILKHGLGRSLAITAEGQTTKVGPLPVITDLINPPQHHASHLPFDSLCHCPRLGAVTTTDN